MVSLCYQVAIDKKPLPDNSKLGRRADSKEKPPPNTLPSSPDVNLEAVGHQELDGVHVAAQVQRRVAVVIRGEEVGAELVQEAADVHVAAGGGQVQARAPAGVPHVGVAARLQQPTPKVQVSVDAGLQQRRAGLRRVVDEDIGHVRVGVGEVQLTWPRRGDLLLLSVHGVGNRVMQ